MCCEIPRGIDALAPVFLHDLLGYGHTLSQVLPVGFIEHLKRPAAGAKYAA